jgi:hypothetical protein
MLIMLTIFVIDLLPQKGYLSLESIKEESTKPDAIHMVKELACMIKEDLSDKYHTGTCVGYGQ